MISNELIYLIEKSATEPFYLVGSCVFNYITDINSRYYDVILSENLDKFLDKIKMFANFNSSCDESNCIRVYFPLFKATVRFVNTDKDIVTILHREAFTLNGIAIEFLPHKGYSKQRTSRIIDPFNGIEDIKNNIVRGISEDRLLANPVYLLKAIKYMAKYKFTLAEDTLNIIKRNSKEIPFDKYEVTLELFDILKYKNAHKYIRLLDELTILQRIFPEILPMKKTKNEKSGVSVWEHSLLTLEEVEKVIYANGFFVEHIKRSFERNGKKAFSTGRTKEQLLKLCALFHDIGKPHTNNNSEFEKYRFYGHHIVGGKLMKSICKRLGLAEDECKFSRRIVKEHMRAIGIFDDNMCCMEKQYEVFHTLKSDIYDVFLLGIGDNFAKDNYEINRIGCDYKVFIEEIIDIYITKYQELGDINNIVDNYDVPGLYDLDDGTVLELLDEAKRDIFFGNLDYKKIEILKYLNRKIN